MARVRAMSPEEIEEELMAIRELKRKRAKTPLQTRIADALRKHRESDTGLSQEQFADHIGMHRAQYGAIERGTRDLRLSTLLRAAKGLERPAWVILKEAEGADS